jgi:glycosyltransferase involved in cell wall biosynthesis
MLESSYKVVLVGLNRKQIKSLPENILGLPRTENAQRLAEVYTSANVYVNLSDEENYPLVNLEAQACGTKVIAYDVGGMRETLNDMNINNIVEAGELDKVRKLIYELCR